MGGGASDARHVKPCVRCGGERNPGRKNPWCRACLAAYMRGYRRGERLRKPLTDEERKQRRAARTAANYRKRRGELEEQPCASCGATEGLEMHHEDYSKPLEVTWLCHGCHCEQHLAELEITA